jgi:hypothetical protein
LSILEIQTQTNASSLHSWFKYICTEMLLASPQAFITQKVLPAAFKPSSKLSGVYSFMGGQDFAPHTSAK